jgi:hypothetical protein
MVLKNQILQAIQDAMPTGAKIYPEQSDCPLIFQVSWELNDPERPSKKSRTISICVSEEAIQDFEDAPLQNQESASQRVFNFLNQKLSAFNPEHDTPAFTPPPVEQWIINSSVLNG